MSQMLKTHATKARARRRDAAIAPPRVIYSQVECRGGPFVWDASKGDLHQCIVLEAAEVGDLHGFFAATCEPKG